MRFLCARNYRTDHIIERFHEENSIMSGLSKNVQNHPSPVVTFDRHQNCSASCQVMKINGLRVTHQQEFVCNL